MTIHIGWSLLWVFPLFWAAMNVVVIVTTWRDVTSQGRGPAIIAFYTLVCAAATAWLIGQQL